MTSPSLPLIPTPVSARLRRLARACAPLLLVGAVATASDASRAASVRQLCRFPDGERRVVYQSVGSGFRLAVDNCEELPGEPAEPDVEPEARREPLFEFRGTPQPLVQAQERETRETQIRAPVNVVSAPVARVNWTPQPPRAAVLFPTGGPAPLEYQRLIARSARNHGVDPLMVEAVMYVESRFRPDARSQKGALGLMQLMPGTAQLCGVYTASRLFDPATNIECGARYLGELTATFAGRIDLTLAAYNAGPGAVAKHGMRIPPFAETQAYVERVLQRLRAAR